MKKDKKEKSSTVPSQKEPPVLHSDAVDLTRIKFGEAKKSQLGGIFQTIHYGDAVESGNSLKIQTPVFRVPFGITSFQNTTRVQLSFDIQEDDPLKQFYDFVNIFEDVVVLHGQRDAKSLFTGMQGLSADIIKSNFKSAIRKSGSFPPLMSIKIPMVQGASVTKVFHSRQPVPLESIKKNAQICVIAEPSFIWVVNKNWGVSWKALQIRIEESGGDSSLSSYSFLESADDEDDEFVSGTR